MAGLIDAIAGAADGYVLSRADQTLPVGLLLPVLEGDEISVRQEGGVLTIRYTDGHTDEITKANSPFRVKLHGRPVALSDKLLGLLRWTGEKRTPLGPAGARGGSESDPPAWLFPGLKDGSARVVRGERRLGLAWDDGKSPYRVTVKGPDGAALLEANVGSVEVLTIEPRKLAPGRHEASVEDAEGRRLSGAFTVVEAGTAPAAGDEPPAWLGAGVARAIRARELAEKDGGAWCYEAYLSLIGVEKDFGLESHAALVKRLRREICD
jgi:hypothetical protein